MSPSPNASTLPAPVAPAPDHRVLLERLALARWRASQAVPYLARGLWACVYFPSEAVPTLAIDRRWRVLVNPLFALEHEKDLPGLLVHEAMHQILRHGKRAETIQATDHSRWNECGDCEINHRIDEIKALTLPGGLRAEQFGWKRGLCAEEYYRQEEQKSGKGGQQPKPDGETCSGGSGAGAPHPAEGELPGDGEPGPQGLTEAEGDLVRASIAATILQQAKQKPGSVPGSLLRWAEEYGAAPAVDWRALAQARIRYATEARRGPAPTYARPSRRSIGSLILPVYRQPQARIAIVCDTSGSMGQEDIGTALAVVVDACNACGSVTALACDASAGEAVQVRSVDDLKDYFKGGGGTDMVRGIQAAAESVPAPDCIVVVTDGETPWPASAPDVPCVVILTRKPSYCAAPPVWAEVIEATPTQAKP